MTDNIENLLLEHLKRFQAGQDRIERKLDEHTQRLGRIEVAVARVARDEGQNYSELIEDRQIMDKLKERIERIERRLQLEG